MLQSFRVHQFQLFFRGRTALARKTGYIQRRVSQTRHFTLGSVNCHRVHIRAVTDLNHVSKVDFFFPYSQIICQLRLYGKCTVIGRRSYFNTVSGLHRKRIFQIAQVQRICSTVITGKGRCFRICTIAYTCSVIVLQAFHHSRASILMGQCCRSVAISFIARTSAGYMHILHRHVIRGSHAIGRRRNRDVRFASLCLYHALICVYFINRMAVSFILCLRYGRIGAVLQFRTGRLQLGYVHCIGQFRAGRHVGDLAGLSVTAYRNCCQGRFPGGIALGGCSLRCRIVAGHAAANGSLGIYA